MMTTSETWLAVAKATNETPNQDPEQANNIEEIPEEDLEREQWDSKLEFLLSCVGLSVGLGNLWRFPYLAYDNGGAVFMIAYFILQVFVGKPMYFLELSIGQYSGKGPTRVWDVCPAARGVGFSMCLISVTVAIYYNTIMAYCLMYFFGSMQETLPWTKCKEKWKTENGCVENRVQLYPDCVANFVSNCTCTGDVKIDKSGTFTCTQIPKSPAELYFFNDMSQTSDGIDIAQMGTPLGGLTGLLLLSWVLTIVCLLKGIKSSGKVVYFTATFPYLVLFVLLIRGLFLEGALEGVKYFVIPKWHKLKEIKLWTAALSQMFFSLNCSFGGIIMFGSYTKFRNRVHIDAMIISFMDLLTSIIAGFVVFTTLGGLANILGTSIDKVVKSGFGLAFIVYPEALSHLYPPQLWSVIFFFMLFILGLDSEFGLMETCLTAAQDEFPKLRKYKAQLSIILGCCCFLLAIPTATPGGLYVVTLMDTYGGTISVLFVAWIEVMALTWVYGAVRLLKDIEYMLGAKPHGWNYWIFTWTVTTPISIGGLLIYKLAMLSNLKYDNGDPYPTYVMAIAWILFLVILCPVPIFFFHRCYQSFSQPKGKKMSFIFGPTEDWIPNDKRCTYLSRLKASTNAGDAKGGKENSISSVAESIEFGNSSVDPLIKKKMPSMPKVTEEIET